MKARTRGQQQTRAKDATKYACFDAAGLPDVSEPLYRRAGKTMMFCCVLIFFLRGGWGFNAFIESGGDVFFSPDSDLSVVRLSLEV